MSRPSFNADVVGGGIILSFGILFVLCDVVSLCALLCICRTPSELASLPSRVSSSKLGLLMLQPVQDSSPPAKYGQLRQMNDQVCTPAAHVEAHAVSICPS